MAIATFCRNKLKPVQYIEVPLRVLPLFRMITRNLTNGG